MVVLCRDCGEQEALKKKLKKCKKSPKPYGTTNLRAQKHQAEM